MSGLLLRPNCNEVRRHQWSAHPSSYVCIVFTCWALPVDSQGRTLGLLLSFLIIIFFNPHPKTCFY